MLRRRRSVSSTGQGTPGWLACVALVATGLLGVPSRGDGQAQASALARYYGIVQEYRLGRQEAAVRDLLALEDRSARQVVEQLCHNLETKGDLSAPWTLVDVEAAAVFHSELAIQGILDSALQPRLQLELARRLAEVTIAGGRQVPALGRDFRRRWHLLVAWRAHGLLEMDDAAAELEKLRRSFGVDAELLLTAGSLSETLAWPALANSLPAGVVGPRQPLSRRFYLKDAEAKYRRAVALAPELGEARLRLGRVLYDQGRYDDAVSALEPALTSPHDTWIRYLGHLFAGAACERSGRVADATAHYRTSVETRPEAQTGAVALSFLLRQQGESGTAREALSPLMSAVKEQAQDPWWDYFYGQWRHVPVALLAMRREVAR
jgi:tetratricopeptide (TPR) repeat protein